MQSRRWFLGAVGSLVGMAAVPLIGNALPLKVEIVEPKVITDSGAEMALHQMGFGVPENYTQGFAYGAIWGRIDRPEVYVNAGGLHESRWFPLPGDRTKALGFAMNQQLARYQSSQNADMFF